MNVLAPDQGDKKWAVFGGVLIAVEVALLVTIGLAYLGHNRPSPLLWVLAVIFALALVGGGVPDIRRYRKQQSICPGDQTMVGQYKMLRNNIVGALRHMTWKYEAEQYGDKSVYSVGERLLVTAMPAKSSVAFQCELLTDADRVLDPHTLLPTDTEFCTMRRYAIFADGNLPIRVKSEALVFAGHDELDGRQLSASDFGDDWSNPAQHLMLLSDLEELLSYLRELGL